MTDDQERKPHRKRELTAMDPESLNFKALAVILALLGVLLGYLPAYWFWFVRPIPDQRPGIRNFKRSFKAGAFIVAGVNLAGVLVFWFHHAHPDVFKVCLWPQNSCLLLAAFVNCIFIVLLSRALGQQLSTTDRVIIAVLALAGAGFSVGEVRMEIAGNLAGCLHMKVFLIGVVTFSVWLMMARGTQWLEGKTDIPGQQGRDCLALAATTLAMAWTPFAYMAIPNF